MSAIYRPARKAAKSVAKAVSKPIKWVGDTVGDVGEWAVEEVFDPVIEEGRIHYQRKVNKLDEYRLAEKHYGKPQPEVKEGEAPPKVYKNPVTIAKELRDINTDIKAFEAQVEGKDIYDGSPVKNGYTLSRLEQKLEKRNSFYQTVR
jgi:hypothetical protein